MQYICNINNTKWLPVIWWRHLLLCLLLYLLALTLLGDHDDGHLLAPNCQTAIKAMVGDVHRHFYRVKKKENMAVSCEYIMKYSVFHPTDQ